MKKIYVLFVFIVVILCYCNLTLANDGTQKKFEYQWHDHQDKPLTLSFSLDKTTVNSHFRRFKRFNQTEAFEYVHYQVLKSLAQFDPRQLMVTFDKQNGAINYQLSGSDQAILTEAQQILTSEKQAALARYLESQYYIQFSSPWQTNAIKPDHIRFINESIEDLEPIKAEIIKRYKNTRPQTVINFILSWVQSIPYETLEDKTRTSGLGFNPPLKMLSHNQGDCDSKSVMAAALIKAIYPNLKIAFIVLPEHALIGIHLPVKKGEKFIDIDGLKYILAEPTGPNKMPISIIDDDSWRHIQSGQFSYELI